MSGGLQLGLTWSRKSSPAAKTKLEPTAWPSEFTPTFTTNRAFLSATGARSLCSNSSSSRDCFPFENSARQAQTPGSLQAADGLPAQTPQSLVGRGLAHQFVQAQLARTPLHAPSSATALRRLQLRACGTSRATNRGWADHWAAASIAPRPRPSTSRDLDLHQQHHPCPPAFRAIHFQPDLLHRPAASRPPGAGMAGGQANLFQFPAPSAALHPRLGAVARAGQPPSTLFRCGGTAAKRASCQPAQPRVQPTEAPGRSSEQLRSQRAGPCPRVLRQFASRGPTHPRPPIPLPMAGFELGRQGKA